ncbi:DUF4192 family protein [Kineococcus auxinigenes]|uniref:DUF4192 family protein n=1 Tax=unclassified Kineococcus TaxID=2621656 RepID=UPI003D7E977B
MTTDAAPQPPLVLSGPGELLAVLPYRLGFHPRHSLVLLELRTAEEGAGDRARLGAVVRVDLPGPAEPPVLERLAETAAAGAVDRLLRVRAVAGPSAPTPPVVVACYDETGLAAAPASPEPAVLRAGAAGAAAVAAALTGLRATGSTAGEALLVAGGRWRSLSCADARCCPPEGLPLLTPGAGRVAAEAVGRGLSALADRDALLPERTPLPPERLRAAGAARRAAGRGAWTPQRRLRALAEFEREVRRHLPPAAPALPDPAVAGRLLAALQDVPVRDAALLTGAPAHLRAPAVAALVHAPGAGGGPAGGGPAADLVHRALDADHDRPRTVAAAALAVDLARHAPGAPGAAAWALAGWAYWSVGDGVRAGACAAAALEADPDHRLAGLVTAALRVGLPPRGGAAR